MHYTRGAEGMSKVFSFDKQLAAGNKGEELFLRTHPDIKRLDGRRGDFMGETGRLIELKTESRPSTTPNMFVERYSDVDKRSPGGPWQSAGHGAFYLVQVFGDGVALWFEVTPLLLHLRRHEKTYKLHYIRNQGWCGAGYAIKQTELAHLVILREELK